MVNLKYKPNNSVRYTNAKKIEKFISKDEELHEINKCVKILGEIDKIMRTN